MFGTNAVQRMRQNMMAQMMAGRGFDPARAAAGAMMSPGGMTPGAMVPAQAPAPPATLFGAPAAPPAQQQQQQPPPQMPPPAQPSADDPIMAIAPKITPDDSPLAMEASARPFQAKKPTMMNQLGFLAQAFNEGPRGYTEGRDAWEQRQRRQFADQQTMQARTTAIDVVRRILAKDNDPTVRAVAQMAGTPEAFIEWYPAWKEAQAQRELKTREIDIGERQGDRGLDQNDRRLDMGEEEMKAGLNLKERELGLGWFDAQTRRKIADDSLGSRDPVEKGLIANDVQRIDAYETSAAAAQEVLPVAARLDALLDEGVSAGPFTLERFGIMRGQRDTEFQSVVDSLFPALGEQIKGVLSETDSAKVMNAAPGLDKDEQTNRNIINAYRNGARRLSERAQLARQFMKQDRSLQRFNGLYSRYMNDVQISAGDGRTFSEWFRDVQMEAGKAQSAAAAANGAQGVPAVSSGRSVRDPKTGAWK